MIILKRLYSEGFFDSPKMFFLSAGPRVIVREMAHIMAAKIITTKIFARFATSRLYITKAAVAIFGTE
jgi:hypothetical protein